jgi:cysteine-rich repeat protein
MPLRRFGWLLVVLFGCASGAGSSVDGGRRDDEDAGTDDVGPPDPPSICGNGSIETGEECDLGALGDATCESLGYAGGLLACDSLCSFDKSACVEAACGNGVIDGDEACDGASLGPSDCVTEGFVDGELRCGADCELDTSACRSCGDGVVDLGEECDGAALAGETCATRGFTAGALACDAACGFDTSACTSVSCGNGTRDATEVCDGGDLGDATCATLGFVRGTLRCGDGCTFDVSGCDNCGNGVVNGAEACDRDDLGGQTCATRGFTRGTLACDAACGFDTSRCIIAACGNGALEPGEACDDGNDASNDGCSASCAVELGWTCAFTPSVCSPTCGDGSLRGGEACDGTNLGGQSCTTQGFVTGMLRCSASCTFDTSACANTTCGNGALDGATEECDDGNTVRFDGCDSGCQVEAGYHLPVRLRGGEGSNHGRVEVLFEGTWRDVCDDTPAASQPAFANVVCRQLGYTGTGHQFLAAFGGGTATPAMDDVACAGSESSLAQCAFAGWGRENCSAFEAVGVRCVPGEGDIRLVDGPSGMEGRLQIFHAGAWGEVCDDYFDGAYDDFGYNEVTVCQQLGYENGVFLSTYDSPTATFVLDDVNCTGTERRLGDCLHPPYGTENCFTSEGAGIRCDVHTEGDLRLVAGTARNNGRIEVLRSGVWGTICDDFLSTADMRQSNFIAVGCRQLGFTTVGTALLGAAVTDGVDPIWLDDLSCGGAEAQIGLCTSLGWGVHNCSHAEDIGLSCTP